MYALLSGRSRSRSVSRSRSPRYHPGSRGGHRSRYFVIAIRPIHSTDARGFIMDANMLLFRSYSPSPRRRDEYSASPGRRPADHTGSPGESPRRDHEDWNEAANGYDE